MRKGEIERARREAENSPVAWFVMLERARTTGDFERAAQAVRELKRLGVTVTFGRQPTGTPHE
jgi:5,10-methylenetetrahydrofolate reductase